MRRSSNPAFEELLDRNVGMITPNQDRLGFRVAALKRLQARDRVSASDCNLNRQDLLDTLDDKVDFLVSVGPIEDAVSVIEERGANRIFDEAAVEWELVERPIECLPAFHEAPVRAFEKLETTR